MNNLKRSSKPTFYDNLVCTWQEIHLTVYISEVYVKTPGQAKNLHDK